MNRSEKIKKILTEGTLTERRALFEFSTADNNEIINLKFNLWSRYFFSKYFSSKDAGFHAEIDLNNIKAYKGAIRSFTDIAFRGAAKTVRTKLFLAFCICNDTGHFRKYIKVLTHDSVNGRQITTDVYNMLVNYQVAEMYPEVFEKTNAKREETMSSFTTATLVKMISDTVGTDQRGAIQEESRPDLIWFEDFENRTTLRSARKTIAIWDNMEEARTGLAVGGACVYTCNYISEQGNVHRLVMKASENDIVLIVPIIKDGVVAWDRYTLADINLMKATDDDFEGERLCKPSASRDVLFDREKLDEMKAIDPIKEIAGLKIFKEYDPSHRYGSGHDVAGGIGLDSSTSVFIDFDTIPAQVVATFANNNIKPEIFGDEIYREAGYYDYPICGVERNYGTEAILRLKQLGANLYKTERSDVKINKDIEIEYGWQTNSLTKPKMLFSLAKAVSDGIIQLNDVNLINEIKGYTRDDLLTSEKDPRLITRHFDLLIACAIAWQMRNHSEKKETIDYSFLEDKPIYNDIGI
jgi:hypothetical protein